MNKSSLWGTLCILASFFLSPVSAATTIVGASSIISPQGSNRIGFELNNIINQSGLSEVYTSGVTDFDSYITSVTHDGSGSNTSGFTDVASSSGQFSFDLGIFSKIDALAFWNTETPGSVTSFNLYTDTDQDFGNGIGALLGTFSPTSGGGQPSSGQVFAFDSVSTQFLHIDVLSVAWTVKPNLKPGIGEVAFSSATFRNGTSVVPIPAAAWLFGSGLLGLIGMARRKKAA